MGGGGGYYPGEGGAEGAGPGWTGTASIGKLMQKIPNKSQTERKKNHK